jgi:DNA-binding transcriptional regulator YhcF (GntR family)
MSKPGKGKKKLSRFIALEWSVVDSKAWEQLTNAARVAYIHLKRKVTNSTPGEITLSYNQMEKFMNRHTFADALTQLERKGFIEKTQMGGLYRRRNFFRLINEWRNGR